MADEDKTQQEGENGTTEGEDAQAAGPVSDEASSSSQAAGDEASSSPPAADASEEKAAPAEGESGESAEGSAPEAEEPSEEVGEVPVAEEVTAPEADQTSERAEKPKAAEKKDVIPGADLEPILVEPEGPELSAEERARLEAEEEEKARREAELAAAEVSTASRAPAKMEAGARFLATGKRKSSIARVTLVPGNGKIEINRRSLEEFFPRPLHQSMVRQPLAVSGYEGNVDVRVRVHGGGISGQAGAVRHGVARALTEIDSELRGDLKRRGFLTRDARVKERRKAGLKKARKRPQFSKR
jgi:small subunit ribosomal protein S9